MKNLRSLTLVIAVIAIAFGTLSCTKDHNIGCTPATNCADSLQKRLTPTFSSMTTVESGATSATISSVDMLPTCENRKVARVMIKPSVSGLVPAGSVLRNLSLYYKGAQVGSTHATYDIATPVIFDLGSQVVLIKDTFNTLMVKADITDPSGVPYTAGTITLTVWIPTGSLMGFSTHETNGADIYLPTQTLRIGNAGLALAKFAAMPNTTVSANSTGVRIGAFVMQNTNMADALRVISIRVDIGGTTTLSNVNNLRTSEMSGNGATPLASVQATNNFSVDYIVPSGITKSIDLFADLGPAIGVTVITSMKVTYLNTVSNVMMTTDLVTGQTVTTH